VHKILLEKVFFTANHGVFDEETIIGARFEVNLEIETDFSKSAKSDDLTGTVDYSKVYEAVEEEMKSPSKLIEHLGQRIIDRLYKDFTTIQFIRLKISKLNPPIKGQIAKVSIVIEE